MKAPLVSVIIPVFNCKKYLAGAIRSVLDSDYSNLEVWAIDDGSTDGSREQLSTFSDPRLNIVFNEKNSGVAVSLNRLIGKCKGTYIARMDADDLCLKNRFRLQVDYLEQHTEIGVLGGQVKCFPGEPRFTVMPLTHEVIKAWSLFASPMIHPTVMWRRELNLRYQETPPTAEDYDLWVKCSRITRLGNLKEAVIQYRQDFSVKKVSYLEEQKCGGFEIRKKQLDELGVPENHPGREIHEKLSQLRVHPASFDSSDVAAWLKELVEINDRNTLYSKEALLVILGRKWYDFHVNEAISGRPAFRSFLEEELSAMSPLWKKTKLFLRSLRNFIPPR